MKVFVYGTLKPGERNYPYYCGSQVIDRLEAYTPGYLYALSLGYPALTPGAGKVRGFLLTFVSTAALNRLDQLEDYHPQRDRHQNEYQRQLLTVYATSGRPLGEAWGYLMLPEKVRELGGVFLPSGWWTENR
ncbi:MAG: gamma-glutamylcyclotransferase [Chloroflexaceae bacterium]|nr:gamma-glutamylcyclotransferase [Chloroflexaceae bacterium]